MPALPAAPALALHPWPGALPVPQNGLIIVSSACPAGTSRELARERIRLAVRQALAHLLGQRVDAITLESKPGQAPRILLTASGSVSGAGISISHEDGLSVAAVNLHGPVGVDLMRVAHLADWHSVARDYLGPLVADALAALAPEHRAHAFARAWTERESSLKCLGLALREWAPIASCRCIGLALPAGLCGTLAVLPG